MEFTLPLTSTPRPEEVVWLCPSNFILLKSGSLDAGPYQVLKASPYSGPCGIGDLRYETASIGGSSVKVRELPDSGNTVLSSSQGRLILVRCTWEFSPSRASITQSAKSYILLWASEAVHPSGPIPLGNGVRRILERDKSVLRNSF